ncbi:MAG: penicillin-binding protein activator LpoB [Leptospirales bacterium]|nr:penicillin-binding protein activator LpoB [Leptospirales bacterium]
MRKITVLSIILAVFILSCGGGTEYRDASKDKGSMEWGPREIKTTVKTMVDDLYDYLKNEYKNPAYLQVQKIRNRTTEHIDTNMLSNEIVTNLVQKRIRFIDDTYTKEALEEIERGMTGLIDPAYAIPMGEMKSPNFYLFGEISDNVRNDGKKRLQYLVVTMNLTNLRTRELMWKQQQEFLKATTTNKLSF